MKTEVHDIVRRLRAVGGQLQTDAADALESLESEADKLAHEAARESARADKAEKSPPTIEVSDFLNMP